MCGCNILVKFLLLLCCSNAVLKTALLQHTTALLLILVQQIFIGRDGMSMRSAWQVSHMECCTGTVQKPMASQNSQSKESLRSLEEDLFLLELPIGPHASCAILLVRTRRASYLRKGVVLPSKCLLESPFLRLLRRTLLRTLLPSKTHARRLLRALS